MYNMSMKNIAYFILYFILGILLIFSFEKAKKLLNVGELKSPTATSPFSLINAPSESLRGTITSLSGEVHWQSRIATIPAVITKPMQIQQGEDLITGETGQATVVFADIVNIHIYPEAELDFIQTLPSNILINHNKGTAEYKNLNADSLSVRSQSLLIKINQGEIEISKNEAEPYIIVDVKEGSITTAYNDINYITQMTDVSSGNRFIFSIDTKMARILPL